MSLRSLLTRSVVIPIANYAMLSFLDVSFRVLLPLFFSTPTYLGGLGFDPATIGKWMALYGITDGIFQAFFFARIVDWIGPKRLFCISVSCYAPLIVIFPIMSWILRARGETDHAITFALLCHLVIVVTWHMAYVGPALTTSLFAVSKEHNLLGGNAVFVILIALAGGLRWLASQLPDEVQDRDE
ncbi:hypothetical protein F4604DRAFT_1728400 [Suillus subluteus]|nr:hypothetical protein F4604DRAFT_1728400 [Suillus subluteus]